MDPKSTPMLFPYDPAQFWEEARKIIREELDKKFPVAKEVELTVPGLTFKPLLKIAELCDLFQVSRSTISEWVKLGKLKPKKIRSRVFFLWEDVQALIRNTGKVGQV